MPGFQHLLKPKPTTTQATATRSSLSQPPPKPLLPQGKPAEDMRHNSPYVGCSYRSFGSLLPKNPLLWEQDHNEAELQLMEVFPPKACSFCTLQKQECYLQNAWCLQPDVVETQGKRPHSCNRGGRSSLSISSPEYQACKAEPSQAVISPATLLHSFLGAGNIMTRKEFF